MEIRAGGRVKSLLNSIISWTQDDESDNGSVKIFISLKLDDMTNSI
nr:hypothetical protein Q903MT_gene3131 [Picea sitchensis]